MLSQLYIKNIAVIREATIDFTEGLNVFTGETGAGKTILIHAINTVLGERASREMIRTGESQATVSALFTGLTPKICEQLAQTGYPVEEDAILIYREIGADGKTSCKIDGKPATVSILKNVASLLIHIHGQHDNQQLLNPQKHLEFIDGFGGLDEQIRAYASAYHTWKDTVEELDGISTDEAEKARRIDLLRYQIDEISEAQLIPDEEEELRARRKVIQNALHITSALGTGMTLLDGDGEEQSGIVTLLHRLMETLADAAHYLAEAQSAAEQATDWYYEMDSFKESIRHMLDRLDCDPFALEGIEERLDIIYRLGKKYGGSIGDILAFYENACAELEQIENSDERLAALQQLSMQQEAESEKLAAALREARKQAAAAFAQAVCGELAFLDMASARLSVRHAKKQLAPDGGDEMELMLSTNVGEQERSLAKVASGGELARIMLSVKNVMAGRGGVQTMIFDEVDTGVSGRAAQKIGQKLAQVADKRQVIVVTHLAQVAAFAKRHLLISKETKENRTFTSIVALDQDARTRELARITAGDEISEAALAHAREMLKKANQ